MIAKGLRKLSDVLWEIPKEYRHDMRVPARLYATEKMLEEIMRDRSLEQLVNVATLPGIQRYALAMPDIHEGYGMPIGGVFASDAHEGIISPGSVGYDINCGVRLLRSERTERQIREQLPKLAAAIDRDVPSGVGKGGRLSLKGKELEAVLAGGAERMVELGYGSKEDLTSIESNGRLTDADPSLVSVHAKARGANQLGTMGAGNHFIEVDVVEVIFDAGEAERMGLWKDQIVVLIHTGSRGLGHQVATDYIRLMMRVMPRYGIELPDRELACVPFRCSEGQQYWKAMSAAANFAWANRQVITTEVREAWRKALGVGAGELAVVYDVAHNLAKVEEGRVVHRKGATRAFPGQPVLIPGSMGTASYVLVGSVEAMEQTFGSTCHGAGRRMSRAEAKRKARGSELRDALGKQGIVVAAGSPAGLAEEAPFAYKDVDAVVDVVARAGIAAKVARLRPVAVIKG
jgi:tRNA-splicing ligase RtcB